MFDTTEEIEDYEYSGLCLLVAEEPTSVDEALEKCWKNAVVLESIVENNTWFFCELPKGHKAIGLKWVFQDKSRGRIVKYKATIMAKGYAQRQGVDYDEVFASVARSKTMRLLLALAAHGGWEVLRSTI